MLSTTQALVIIGMMALGTMLTRFLPFILFPSIERTPRAILYLGQVLPYAAMGLLVVYCLRHVSLLAAPHGLPEALAILVLAGLHLWKNNTILSISVGTALYMLLVQFIF